METLIRHYSLTITSPPCEPGSERYNALAHVEADLSPVLPYLNAVWPGAVYDERGRNLTWRRPGRSVAIQPGQVALGSFSERAEAETAMRELIEEINAIWAHRGEIEPRHSRRERPNPLQLYKLLPGGNCKACGEASCFAFASKLAAGLCTLEQCPPLQEARYAERLLEARQILALAE